MGPRMREDNGRGWILECVFTGVGSAWEDGFPHARGQGEGMGARAGFKLAPTELIAMWA